MSSTTPQNITSDIASTKGRSGYPKPKAMPLPKKIVKCSMFCDASVIGLYDGGIRDKTTIATAIDQDMI
jgi:hypothetical protein